MHIVKVVCAGAFLFAGHAYATQAWITGTIAEVHAVDSRWTTTLGFPPDYARIVATSGTFPPNCTANGTLFRIRSDLEGQRMYKLLLAARMTNATVTISIDDANSPSPGTNTSCYLDQISM